MTRVPEAGSGSRDAAYRPQPQPSGWLGWVMFAGVMMLALGTFHAIQGLVALFRRDFYLVGPEGFVVRINYATWGWILLIVGVIVAVAGVGVLAGNPVARGVGVVVAAFSALVNLVFLTAYPIWSLIVIALDVIVIYALTVHGGEARTAADGGRAP
jgi:hypothetical protein